MTIYKNKNGKVISIFYDGKYYFPQTASKGRAKAVRAAKPEPRENRRGTTKQ